jgi:hypothetical protein
MADLSDFVGTAATVANLCAPEEVEAEVDRKPGAAQQSDLVADEVIEFDELKLHCPISGDPHEVVWSEDSNGFVFEGAVPLDNFDGLNALNAAARGVLQDSVLLVQKSCAAHLVDGWDDLEPPEAPPVQDPGAEGLSDAPPPAVRRRF